jgi:3-dehydroquinate dehydratase type I
VPVVEAGVNRARGVYVRAARRHFWTEIRLDYLENPDLKRLFRTLPGKVIATNRPAAEGGRWIGPEAARRALLAEAVSRGVHYVDVELSADPAWRREMWEQKADTRIILSWHNFDGTPEAGRLDDLLAEMLAQDAHVLKIVTYANRPEDNLRVLDLIPQARAAGREIIAFCMGSAGTWSRLAAPLLGSFLTFAPFTSGKTSAPGQISVNELRRCWRVLK